MLTFGFNKNGLTNKTKLDTAIKKLKALKAYATEKLSTFTGLYVECYNIAKNEPQYHSFHMHAINPKDIPEDKKTDINELLAKTLPLDSVIAVLEEDMQKLPLESEEEPVDVIEEEQVDLTEEEQVDLIEDVIDIYYQFLLRD